MITVGPVTASPHLRLIFQAFRHSNRTRPQSMAHAPQISLMTSFVTAEAERQIVVLTDKDMLKHHPNTGKVQKNAIY